MLFVSCFIVRVLILYFIRGFGTGSGSDCFSDFHSYIFFVMWHAVFDGVYSLCLLPVHFPCVCTFSCLPLLFSNSASHQALNYFDGFKYRKIWWTNNNISVYLNRNRTATEPQRNRKFCQFNNDQYCRTITNVGQLTESDTFYTAIRYLFADDVSINVYLILCKLTDLAQ